MTDKTPKTHTVTVEEALQAQTIVQEALINLLDKKALISKEELLKEIERIKILISDPRKS